MMDKLLFQLKKFDEAEQFFGEEFINDVAIGECADAYVAKVYDYAPVILKKEDGFESNYFTLINYLTEKKSQHVNGPLPEHTTSYYEDWLTYKQSYNIRKAWFYLKAKDVNDPVEVRDLFIEILGWTNYHAVTTLFNTSNEDYRGHAENAMSYVGNTRAVRDLCMEYLEPKVGRQWQFHLWHLASTTIIEDYGYVFYLGNELSRIAYCPYDYRAQEYYYEKLYTDLYNYLNRDIPKNKGISAERKKEIWAEICENVLEKNIGNCTYDDIDEDVGFEVDDDDEYSSYEYYDFDYDDEDF